MNVAESRAVTSESCMSTLAPTSTLSKRKQSDGLPVLDTAEALQAQLLSAIATYDSAEIALLVLIRKFSFDLVTLQEALKGELMHMIYLQCLPRLLGHQ